MHKLLVICGPTATGKTKLAASLAKKFDGELISADSRQVYRGSDLETNKERPDVPIWLYDVAEQAQQFSVSHWVKLAREAIADIGKRRKLPIVVGGTGFYIRALLNPFETINMPPDKTLRAKNLTLAELQKMIHRGDMNDSDWNNPRRLIRKIETKKLKKRKHTNIYDYFAIGLTAPTQALYKRIEEGLERRKRLGMRETGVNEHVIARKQLTWFKKQPNIRWFDITEPDLVRQVTKKVSAWYTTSRRNEY